MSHPIGYNIVIYYVVDNIEYDIEAKNTDNKLKEIFANEDGSSFLRFRKSVLEKVGDKKAIIKIYPLNKFAAYDENNKLILKTP